MKRGLGIRCICGLVVLFLAFSGAAAAREAGGEAKKGDANVFKLGEVEVSGKKEAVKNVTVDKVSSEEMRLFNADNVAEAAGRLPGVNMSAFGVRNERMVYVRGFDLKHAPIFLDGIPIYVPYDGYPDLGRFTTSDLSEIVVSKGFTSVLYGPNTMGGAINMVSRRPEKTFEGDAGAGYGTGGTYRAHLNLGTNQGRWYVQAGGSYIDSDYFPLSDSFDPTPAEDGKRRENSYYKDESANIKIGFTPNAEDEYALSYIRQHGVKGSPPYAGTDTSQTARYWQWPYWNKESVYFTSRTEFQAPFYLKTGAFYDRFWNSLLSFDDATYSTITRKYAFRSDYNDHTFGGSVEVGTEAVRSNLIKLSLRYKNDIHKEWNEGKPIQTFQDCTLSAGLEDTVTISEELYVIAGASYDMADTVEAEDLDGSNQRVDFEMERTAAFNPQLGIFYTLPGKGVIHAAISRKTRIPSIKDKFSYRLGTAIPNPGLDPEKSINYEIGYQNTFFGRFFFKTTVFHNNITDYILQATVPDPSNPGSTTLQNQNIGKVSQYGAEVEVSGALLDVLEGGLTYAYIHQNNRTNSNKLTNVPAAKAGGYLKCSPAHFVSGLVDVQYVSKMYSSSNGVREAGDFTVVNAKLMCEPVKGITAEAGLDNVFDRNYALDEGFPEPGRTMFANIGYRF
ncbi:MAG: TonB-dependent receptor plug domain-containing protein [Desulfomonilia bacterium]|jgi:iron complex outermembrane receptor protein|uniref:Ferric enterobactin receptor n=1 Tax=anaerobic digester metagenome TaxID=1263854 RepID=A0A485M0N4_9ZZZZ|nr:TonB-dependent receptor [Pseudomonadota bacterium]HRR22264.1 TonB-dependent receptor [Desulfomonilia bacterium]HRR70192.1 TonB-dependent receptor [Desulfomonilia bacterium]HRT45978.1 TonB-dependent receptor [Desulfomonilia bacterium]